MVKPFDLVDKVAIVTGATGLLGTEHSLCLAEAGAVVIIVDLEQKACSALSDRIASQGGGTAVGFAADITDRSQLLCLRDKVLNRFGHIDILINNAAIDDKVTSAAGNDDTSNKKPVGFEEFPLEVWQRVLKVNLTSMFLCCQVFGTPMAERGRGSIINISSTYGIVAPDQRLYRNRQDEQELFKSPAYPVSKGGVIALTRFIAAYWGEKGVRANTLSPGGVRANQPKYFIENYARRTPVARMAEPGDYRGAVLFLSSDASRYMTGANLVVDGGFTIW